MSTTMKNDLDSRLEAVVEEARRRAKAFTRRGWRRCAVRGRAAVSYRTFLRALGLNILRAAAYRAAV